jgi:hypothetical protein
VNHRVRAEVIGIAGQANHDWLTTHGIKPVTYSDGLANRLREAAIDAFIDTYGQGRAHGNERWGPKNITKLTKGSAGLRRKSAARQQSFLR